MKKLEKYKIAPQTKFIKFKGKHFVEIPTIPHDKAVPPLLGYLKSSSSPWMCPYPGSWSLAVAPPPLPGWWHKNHSPLDPVGGMGGGRTLCKNCWNLKKSIFIILMDHFELAGNLKIYFQSDLRLYNWFLTGWLPIL